MLGSKSGGLHYRLLRYILQWSRFYSKDGMKFDLESCVITNREICKFIEALEMEQMDLVSLFRGYTHPDLHA
jgi:hypothetical protein